MAFGFRWTMCTYVGGQYAVHPNFKTYLIMQPEGWAAGEINVQARNTADIVVSGLNFKPTLLMMASYRPRNANLQSDTSFGNRGGGFTFGVAGLSQWGSPWSAATTYDPGDTAELGGVHYVALNTNTNDAPPSANWTTVASAQFTGSTRIRQGWDINGMKRWREDRCFQVVHGGAHGNFNEDDIVLILDHTFDSDGFTLTVEKNLYDQADPIFWLAMDGNFQVGVMDAGTTELTGFNGTPQGACFLSVKYPTTLNPYDYNYWDHMQGFASLDGQNCIWGGEKHASWGWTTERWSADRAILLAKGAQGSSFSGATVEVVGNVTDWHAGGIDLQWDVLTGMLPGNPYRIGWILSGQEGETGYLQADFTKAGIEQLQPTRTRPDMMLMATTNYNFNYGVLDPLALPRSPDAWQSGGGGGIGWHVSPFLAGAGDAWGVHTYGNGVQERGHYANSATGRYRGCIMLAAGANSNPPAQHQHGINVLPNPVIVGTNYRYAERHGHVKRLHVNPSDV